MLRLLVLCYQFPQLYYQYIPQLALVDIHICIPPQIVATQLWIEKKESVAAASDQGSTVCVIR